MKIINKMPYRKLHAEINNCEERNMYTLDIAYYMQNDLEYYVYITATIRTCIVSRIIHYGEKETDNKQDFLLRIFDYA